MFQTSAANGMYGAANGSFGGFPRKRKFSQTQNGNWFPFQNSRENERAH
jgi:hypothetical protein